MELVRLLSAKPPHHVEKLAGTIPDSGRQFVIEFTADGWAVVDAELGKYVVDRSRGYLRQMPAKEDDVPTFHDPSKLERRAVTQTKRRGTLSVQDISAFRKLDFSLPEEERAKAADPVATSTPEFGEAEPESIAPAALAASGERIARRKKTD